MVNWLLAIAVTFKIFEETGPVPPPIFKLLSASIVATKSGA
jgi:hypothetical protein